MQLTIQASLPSNVFLQYPLYIYSVCMLMICFQFSVAVAKQAIPPAHEPLPKPGDPPQPSSKARLASGVQMNSHSLPLFNNHGSGKSVPGCPWKITLITLCSKIASFIQFLLPGLLTEWGVSEARKILTAFQEVGGTGRRTRHIAA